ncbi:hypothetical protein V1525DRAFT_101452 [Lipomyces kononenkoae]|uniref:Uncharacterized protein n=1 Tax=Lipomyces kononenkoae TaxID=34357 RepID=A0ACC3T5E3_LIPKO
MRSKYKDALTRRNGTENHAWDYKGTSKCCLSTTDKKNMYNVDSQESDVAWYLDSGATSHVCHNRKWFKSYVPCATAQTVQFAGKQFGLVLGYGDVVLKVRVSHVYTGFYTSLMCARLFLPVALLERRYGLKLPNTAQSSGAIAGLLVPHIFTITYYDLT